MAALVPFVVEGWVEVEVDGASDLVVRWRSLMVARGYPPLPLDSPIVPLYEPLTPSEAVRFVKMEA